MPNITSPYGRLSYSEAEPYTLEDEDLVNLGIQDAIEVEDLFIHPSHRGQGRATELLQQFLTSFPHRNIVMQAYPYEEDFNFKNWEKSQTRLVDFYSRLGFTHIGGGWLYRKAKAA